MSGWWTCATAPPSPAGHVGGTLGFELSEDSFVTYLGWLYSWGAPLTPIGTDTDQIADTRRELVRIGHRTHNPTVLDVRQRGEYDDGHLPGALNIPLHELSGRIGEVPRDEVWVHCASGYRSSIAASMIDGPDRTVVLVDGSFEQAEKLGLVSERSR